MKKIIFMAVAGLSFASCKNQKIVEAKFSVNEATSKVEWKGSAPDHFHIGSFAVSGSLAATSSGLIKSGNFVIPITSIQDYDLTDPTRQALLTDLRDNFFKIAIYPEAKFHITAGAQPYNLTDTNAVQGADYLLTGDYTLLGQTHSVSFPAKINVTADSVMAEAKFNIDRSKWGMDNYNDPSAHLYILPQVNIHLNIKAGKSGNATL